MQRAARLSHEGEAIPLLCKLIPDDEYLGLHEERTGNVKLRPEAWSRLSGDAWTLKGVRLLPRSDLSREAEQAVDEFGALCRVFREGSALVVVLPEVRAGAPEPTRDPKLRRLAVSRESPAEIVRERDERFVLRPTSGRSEDASASADRLHEEAEIPLAQARALRLVP